MNTDSQRICVSNMNNNMYVYSQLIKELEPDYILDIGMMLYRYGLVSRDIFLNHIPESIRLCGAYNGEYPKVYNKVYDRLCRLKDSDIESLNGLLSEYLVMGYRRGLCYVLNWQEWMDEPMFLRVVMSCYRVFPYVVVNNYDKHKLCNIGNVLDITSDDEVYYILIK